MQFWRALVASRWFRVLTVVVAIAIPIVTLPSLPRLELWPALLALVPWTIGKYVLCPLRWHGLSESGRTRRWHLAAYAESELIGQLTPGHVGADVWRIKRLHGVGMARGSAAAEVALDRLVGAIGLATFVGLAGAALPVRQLLAVLALSLVLVVAVLVVRRLRPEWIPRREWPSPRRLARGLALSMGYQASIVILLLGALLATGHAPPPLVVAGAFGASQLAGVVPGPSGVSPRDGALVLALVAFGVPWASAVGAVLLKALLAWAPALLLGGGCLLVARRAARPVPATALL